MAATSHGSGRRRAAESGHCTPGRVIAGVAVLAVALGFAVVATTPAHAEVTVIEVTNTDDSGPGSLRDALAEAQREPSDDRITFAPTITGTIVLTSGELDAAVGASSGSLTIEGPGPDHLTVDAGGQSRVLDVQGAGGEPRPTVVVSGLTLTGGVSDHHDGTSSIADWYGGALRTTGVDLVLERLTIADSAAFEGGGGIAVVGASVLVSATTITGNSAGSEFGVGGGIHFDDGEAAGTSLVVHDSIISDNTAALGGGGIHTWGRAPVTVTDSTVSDNTAAHTWRGMEAAGIEGDGGGISAGDLTVVDSQIIGNEAGRRGGGLHGQSVVVTRSTISDNVAGEAGGGIRVEDNAHTDGELRVESSTLTGNRADVGGGVHVETDMPAEVRLSTVAANAAVIGGGLYVATDVAMQGSIVAMNAGGDLAGDGRITLDRSLVQDPRGATYVDNGGSTIGLDPLLGPLADHGGPTETLLPASNSPVIDLGDAFGAATDQRGFPRPVDDADVPDASDGSDIGALELTQVELTGLPQVGSTARPVISGRVRVGETLRTDGGTWEPAHASLSYQWLRNGVPISGATSAWYTLTPDDYDRNWYGEDLRKRVSLRITASATGYRSASAFSDYTRHVARGILEASRPARVTGKLRVGSTLRARPRLRAISPRPTGVGIQWFLDGRKVSWAIGQRRFELKPRMRGQRVKVRFFYWPPDGYHPLKQVAKRRRPVR